MIGRFSLVASMATAFACGNGEPQRETDSGIAEPTCVEAPAAVPARGNADCPVAQPPAVDRFDEALAHAGLNRCSLGFDDRILNPRLLEDYALLPLAHNHWNYAMNAPAFGEDLAHRLDQSLASATPLASAIAEAAHQLGFSVERCAATNVSAHRDAPLAAAVAQLIAATNGEADLPRLTEQANDVPYELQRAMSAIVHGIINAVAARERATRLMSDAERQQAFEDTPAWLVGAGVRLSPDYDAVLAGTRFDYAEIYQAAASLAQTVESIDWRAFAGTTGFSFTASTPIGDVILRDGTDNVYTTGDHPGAIALLVDTGGVDHYQIPVGATFDHRSPVAIALDLGGSDRYGYNEVAHPADTASRLPSDRHGRADATAQDPHATASTVLRQGAGALGVGLLWDLGGGDDHYRSLRSSQGFGALGVGALHDDGGDDRYESEVESQGFGAWGMGIVLDASGSDRYRAYTHAQGSAFVFGAGVLADGGDDSDVYYAEPDDVLYSAAQLPGVANRSFAQGAAMGLRGNAQLASRAGGLGMLHDQGGNDHYTAGVFGQSAGFWWGTGILSDRAGDDTYDGYWYVQSAAAHFATAVFLDHGGHDRFNETLAPHSTSIGVGHDLSIAIHINRGGNDLYRAPSLSLGSGNANGIGILVNTGGNDHYEAAGEPTMAAANLSREIPPRSSRESLVTAGLFVDVGGTDTYVATGSGVGRGNDSTWINPRRNPAVASEKSAGLDTETGNVTMP